MSWGSLFLALEDLLLEGTVAHVSQEVGGGEQSGLGLGIGHRKYG